jgi:hypothetical protein
MPLAGASFAAFNSSTSACSNTLSSSLSMPSPVLADTGTNIVSPPHSSGTTSCPARSCLIRSGFASGRSILFSATTIGTFAAFA